MKRFEDYQREYLVRRVRRHREMLRESGLRPVQIWVIDTRAPGFGAECKRQCQVVGERQQSTRRPPRRRWIKLHRGDLVAWGPERRKAFSLPPLPPEPPQHGLVIQHDAFCGHAQVAIVPVARSPITELNSAPFLNVAMCEGLHAMIDQLRVIPRRSIKGVYGRVDDKSRLAVDRALALYLGIVR